MARILALRFEEVTSDLISHSQQGFIKGRNIAKNIRKTEEIIAYTKKSKKKALIVTIDFDKCFDRVEFKSIEGALRYFNFGERFISWVMLLYRNCKLCTQNNGYFSSWFDKTRGCAQGCPVSPTCFLYCSEVMTHLIKQRTSIKGICINQLEEILAQFADDTSIFLEWDQESLNQLCEVLSIVETNIGLKVSYDKTSLYRIGSLTKSEARLYTTQNFKWNNENIDTLGVKIARDGTKVPQNFEDIVNKLENVCNDWRNRTLTLMGKVLIVNSLMGSLFVYKMSSMLKLSKTEISTVEKIMHNFLWGGRRARISMKTLQKNRQQGGLRLVDLTAKQKALQVKWVFMAEEDPFLNECMYNNLNRTLKTDIWLCNLHPKHVKKLFDDSFWLDILEAWCEINYREEYESKNQVLSELLWFNSKLCIENKPFLFVKWFQNGIRTVEDIVDARGNLISIESIEAKWGFKPMWLDYNSLKMAFPEIWKFG